LRKRWHATTLKLLGKNKLGEICDFAAGQIGKIKIAKSIFTNYSVKSIQLQMEKNLSGFDPKTSFILDD